MQKRRKKRKLSGCAHCCALLTSGRMAGAQGFCAPPAILSTSTHSSQLL